MLSLLLNIVYVVIAIAMIGLILLQRGAGAQAGSGFGGGASGTVFGAQGSANFMSKTTKWLAVAFFGITLLMAWLHVNATRTQGVGAGSVMAGATQAPLRPAPGAVSAPASLPQATPTPAPVSQPVPAAPAASTAPAAQPAASGKTAH